MKRKQYFGFTLKKDFGNIYTNVHTYIRISGHPIEDAKHQKDQSLLFLYLLNFSCNHLVDQIQSK